MIRKWMIPILVATALFTSIHATDARAIFTLHVQVNGTPIELDSNNMDARPYIEQETNTTYVPLRFVSEHLGAQVKWDQAQQQVTITANKGDIVTLTLGSTIAYVNGESQSLTSPPVMPTYPNRVMVPLRFISEHLGAKVNAQKSTNDDLNITITTSNKL